MRPLLIILALALTATAQTNQTMINSPGGVQSASGNAALPVPYDTCPKGYRCQVIGWYQCCDANGKMLPWKPIYYVHPDGTKIVQYMIIGKEPVARPKKKSKRRHSHAQAAQGGGR